MGCWSVWEDLEWIGDKNNALTIDKELPASKREELVFLRDDFLADYPMQNKQPWDHIQARDTKQIVWV